jgi:triphosphatase
VLETELKLTASNSKVLETIVASSIIQKLLVGSALPTQQFLARYHDTADQVFQQKQCSLRSRLEGDRFRAAFKEKGQIVDGLSSRNEWECDIHGWLQSTLDLPESDLRSRVSEMAKSETDLETLVVVDMERSIFNLEWKGTKIECVTDSGTIQANGRTIELHELELELKQGDVDKIIKLGNQLKDNYELIPSTLSKHQLGLQLWNL